MLRRRQRALGAVVALLAALAAGCGLTGSGNAGTSLRGTIDYGSFHSPALGGDESYAVYLPPGYAQSRVRYPVVYFLHGLPASASSYRAIEPIARAVEESGHRAIVVGVQGARDGEGDPEWRDWGPGRNWETAVAVELVRVIDHRYRTIPARAARVIVGISAGGYGATLIADHHPGVYSVIESWSGYFQATNPAGTAVLDLGSAAANQWADFSQQIPHLRTRFAPWWNTTHYAFYVGTNDTRFLQTNEAIVRELRAYRVPHVTFRVYRGAHSWSLWQSHARDWVGLALSLAEKPRPGG